MGLAEPASNSFDILIIGAGISGINAAYRIQTELPGQSYAILEARDSIGGTWDLFRYPGIRSDSDLYTFGFQWRPWLAEKSIADGESIRNYLLESAQNEGIYQKIRFRHKLLSGNWSTADQKWTLNVDNNGHQFEYSAQFLVMCTGYFDYKEPLKTVIPGLSNFKGTVIHPQFWPEDLDYTDKKVVIIGSGATAVTIFPVLAKKTAHITLLQRSPSYILAIPAVDKSSRFLRRFLPIRLAGRILRLQKLILSFLFFQFCRSFPGLARSVLRANCKSYLPRDFCLDPHFNPKYNPWEQRLCVSPDGDFYAALHHSNAEIVTDTIENVTEYSIHTSGGKVLSPDIIVTATGLKVQIAGGSTLTVDEKPIDVTSKFFWKGVMLQDIPNIAFMIGYTNASWTLGADSSSLLVCRILKHLKANKISSVTPQFNESDLTSLKMVPAFNLNSTYIQAASEAMPKSCDLKPWYSKRNYFLDSWDATRWSNLTKGLEFAVKSKMD